MANNLDKFMVTPKKVVMMISLILLHSWCLGAAVFRLTTKFYYGEELPWLLLFLDGFVVVAILCFWTWQLFHNVWFSPYQFKKFRFGKSPYNQYGRKAYDISGIITFTGTGVFFSKQDSTKDLEEFLTTNPRSKPSDFVAFANLQGYEIDEVSN